MVFLSSPDSFEGEDSETVRNGDFLRGRGESANGKMKDEEILKENYLEFFVTTMIVI